MSMRAFLLIGAAYSSSPSLPSAALWHLDALQVACIRIPFGKGVCGAAAATGETQVVADVHAFPGHIACDPDSRSEIVVPVRDHQGTLIAVLDIDSSAPDTFGPSDAAGLEALVAAVFGRAPPPEPGADRIQHAPH